MKLFAAFFSFFCLNFLHCAEAKAATYCNHADRHFEVTSQALAKQSSQTPELNKWQPWPCVAPEEIQFVVLKANCFGPPRYFHSIHAKDFYIRTGLSPPLLFA